MSGTVVSNVFRTSGVIAATAAGINFQSSVVTGTTLSVEAGNGYFIDTTSNICTVTLPSSAAAGDQIVLVDYARTWGTYKIVIDSNGLNFQGQDDTYVVEYNTSGVTVNIVYSGSSKGWTPISDDVVTDAPEDPFRATQKGIFAFGDASGGRTGISNLVNSSGVIASDTSAVGTARYDAIGTGYGYDKGIFRGGYTTDEVSLSNLVNNQGVIASNTTSSNSVTSRYGLSACRFGGDKSIFCYANSQQTMSNIISNQGVMASDVSGVGTGRIYGGALSFSQNA